MYIENMWIIMDFVAQQISLSKKACYESWVVFMAISVTQDQMSALYLRDDKWFLKVS